MAITVTAADISDARKRIRPHVHKTPVLSSRQINEHAGCTIFFKCENFQKVGAFKARGGVNAILSLSKKELEKGVTTHSSGNHAQAIALAAAIAKTPAYIVMPENAPKVKVAAVKDYGAEIIFCDSTLAARESTVEQVIRERKVTFIHPYNDDRIIAGQGTCAAEFLEELSIAGNFPDILLAPVGGGGLLSGTAIAADSHENPPLVYGTEPAGADDAFRSFKAGKLIPQTDPQTIADGLRTSLGVRTFEIIREHVHDILLAEEEDILAAMQLIWERMKIIVEPSSAVALAALLARKNEFQGKKVGIIISGGNVDFSFTRSDNKLYFR